ncbi:MAG: tRNA (adenosine(37)-N6)-threonylcarbamoyltransferase complex dimerization subunit type 1 TsaB [Pirellulales bacterium]|nr:tRNA (adenosine(37)-N6)-threonylcarbamoyltransferase complex dimerization subunit type 1 TsaB [Pirellulales bacterium]
MKILAIETTENVGSVAVAEDGDLLFQQGLDRRLRSAQSLAPALCEVLDRAGWEATDLGLVAVSVGPGSFTGLRVGVTTAKTLAYCAGADILGIDTLETIAAGVPAECRRVAVALDAQRGQVAAAVFSRRDDGWFDWEVPMRLVDVDAWLAELPEEIAVAGPVLRKLADSLPKQVKVLPSEVWAPTAASVARLAARDFAAGRRDDLWKLVPRYSRRSAAEERLDRS